MKIKVVEGMKLKVLRGSQNYNGEGKHSPNVEWIAGSIPVGSIGTVYKAQIPKQIEGNWMFALKFDGITPKEGYFFGLGDEYESESLEEVKS